MTKNFFQKIKTREVAAASLLGALAVLWEIIPGPPFDIPFPLYSRISLDLTEIPIMISLMFYRTAPRCMHQPDRVLDIFFNRKCSRRNLSWLPSQRHFQILLKNIVTKSILAIILRVAVMTVIDYFLLQLFYNMLEFDVVGLLFPIFNVIQTLINIILVYLDLFENIKIQEIR